MSIVSLQDTVNITFAGVYNVLALSTDESGYPALLEWIKDDSFQATVHGYPGSISCYALHAGHIGQRIYFQRQSGEIASLTMPGTVYGKVYMKTS